MNYCSKCGEKVQGDMRFCPACGQKVRDSPRVNEQEKNGVAGITKQTNVIIETADPTFYSDNKGVRVTATRLIIGSKTYSMANITSIEVKISLIEQLIGVLLVLGGIFVLIRTQADNNGLLIGLPLAGLGLALVMFPSRSLRVVSASSEKDALESRNRKYIADVANAINEALIKRG